MDENLWQMFFSWQGRLNRKPFIWRSVVVFGLLFLLEMLTMLVLGINLDEDSEDIVLDNMQTLMLVIFVLAVLVAVIATYMLTIRRLHDLDKTGWLVLLNFVPFVNIAFSIYIMVAEGTVGKNRYGHDPLEGKH